MSLLLTSHPSLLSHNPISASTKLHFFPFKSHSLRLRTPLSSPRFSSSNFSGDLPDRPPSKSPISPTDYGRSADSPPPPAIVDEWGEKTEPETEPATKLSDSDPTKDDDEWGGASLPEEYVVAGNGTASSDKLWELKRCFADTVYNNNLGFSASPEVRAEALELISQLEAENPTPAPMEAAELLDGNWILLYTAFSELLPLLAIGTTPFLKVDKICQTINTRSLTIDNSITFSSPIATVTSSASASFEVRTPSRIQVEFKEGTINPPAIKSTLDNLPEEVDIFGQKISLYLLQQSLNPLQDAAANIARTISGQPPLKIPIPGERNTSSWLITTFLDKDFRISRGDGGLFVLAKEGSPLLNQ